MCKVRALMTSEAKIRIYELAREVGVPSKDLVDKAVTMGFSVKSHQSSLTIEEATAVKKSFGKTGMAAVPSKSASKPTKRRAKAADKPSPKPVAVRPVVRRRKVTDDSAAAPPPPRRHQRNQPSKPLRRWFAGSPSQRLRLRL
jgi:translation initiation factor IF-2